MLNHHEKDRLIFQEGCKQMQYFQEEGAWGRWITTNEAPQNQKTPLSAENINTS